MGQTGFSWLRKRPVASFCEHCNEPSGSIKKQDIFRQDERLSGFQIISCTIE
jgi:hypothetical protein